MNERLEVTPPWHAGALAKAAVTGVSEGQNNRKKIKS
jgi:hypothetical protein